ncbi:MAG: NusG domain II-containing protein [Ruminococcaceae bacterium]|nr:NusG domain II-containing protein [Oscillospiraceae bacterium]
MKKSTKFLAACFSVAAIAAVAGILYLNVQNDGKKFACIYEDGKLLHKIDLSTVSKPYSIELAGNVILIEKEQVSIIEADCPDKLCIKQGAITNGARPIVCLPNNVVVKLTDDESDIDIVTGA